MKISIVIPVYNEADNLDSCLRSIARQTLAPYEVIVVDNNSTDGSLSVAQSFPFVTVMAEQRQGIVHARDRGYDAAAGDIIARIDADSLLPADWLERIDEFYSDPQRQNYAFSGGAAFYNVRFPRAVAWLYNFLAFDLNRWLIGHPTLWGSNMALSRRQWQSVKQSVCRQNGLHEDLDLAIHLSQNGYKIFYDRGLRVEANLKRVRSRRSELWDYLQWWPRTLRRHGRRGWILAWFFGALLLYLLTPFLNLAEYFARWLGLMPLKENLGTDRV